MLTCDYSLSDLTPTSWDLSDEQRALLDASERFAREQLEPLLSLPPSRQRWNEIVEQARSLDLGTLILPTDLGGMGIDHHDLSEILSALSCGPIEHVLRLTQSTPALMTLRVHDALHTVETGRIEEFFDGTRAIALTVPDFSTAMLWRLYDHSVPTAATWMLAPIASGLALVEANARCSSTQTQIARLGGLTLDQFRCDGGSYGIPLATFGCPDALGVSPTQTWLTNTALYLSALLSGVMQHGVAFALGYGMERQTFRKPLLMHQRAATRLADMLIAAQGTQLFVRTLAGAATRAPTTLVRQLARHIAAESMKFTHELVQLCGAHGYVEGLAPAARMATCHWFSMLLLQVDAALEQFGSSAPSDTAGVRA